MLFILLAATFTGAFAYQLTYKDPADTVRWYRTEIALDGKLIAQPTGNTMPITGGIKFVGREKVISVNADGTSTLVSTITDGELHMTLEEQQLTQSLAGYKATFKRAPSGKVTDMKIEGNPKGELAQLQPLGFGNQWKIISCLGQGFEFPRKNLAVGAKWTCICAAGTAKLTMRNILRVLQTVEGVNYPAIDSDMSAKIPDATLDVPMAGDIVTIKQSSSLTARTTALFDTEKGELCKTDFTGVLKVKMTIPGQDGTITISGMLNLTGSTRRIPEPAETVKPEEPAKAGGEVNEK
jgi:hypothetical protein